MASAMRPGCPDSERFRQSAAVIRKFADTGNSKRSPRRIYVEKNKHLEVFYFPRIGVEARDHLVAKFLRFLLGGVGRALVDMGNARFTVVSEAQLRVHPISPSASFRAI